MAQRRCVSSRYVDAGAKAWTNQYWKAGLLLLLYLHTVYFNYPDMCVNHPTSTSDTQTISPFFPFTFHLQHDSLELPMTPALNQVLQHPAIWRVGQLATNLKGSIATGFTVLDGALPNRGWASGEMTEVLANEHGIGEVLLLVPAVKQLTQSGRSVALIAPPLIPFPAAWEAEGILLNRIVVIRAEGKDLLWATEQAAKSGACGMVIAWANTSVGASSRRGSQWSGCHYENDRALRRLHVAAEIGKTALIVYRPQSALANPSPAPTRLMVTSHLGELRIEIAKRRGVLQVSTISLNLHPSHWQSRTIKSFQETTPQTKQTPRTPRAPHAYGKQHDRVPVSALGTTSPSRR